MPGLMGATMFSLWSVTKPSHLPPKEGLAGAEPFGLWIPW